MARYQYVKAQPKRPMRRSILVSFFFIGIGGGILSWVIWPILSFRIFSTPLFTDIISPLSSKRAQQGKEVIYAANGETPSVAPLDYTNVNVWFPKKPQKKTETKVTAYRLTIPKLRIQDALVTIGGEDLNKSLIHYGGTALPGENGNAAIFGHSVLPQFFNPTNYKTIFSTLPTLTPGDDIFLKFDGVLYRYRIEDMVVKDPEDLSMLEQPRDDSYITLITCVPPGTYWQRLHVRARLVKI